MTDVPCKTFDTPMKGIRNAEIREKCNDCMEIDGIIRKALEDLDDDE